MKKYQILIKRIKIWVIRFFLIFAVFALVLAIIFYVNLGTKNTSKYNGPRRVSIQNKNGRFSFYRDGKPFIAEGAAGFTHIKELSDCGGNTIMCWDTSKLENTFKDAAKNNLVVIIGLDIPSGELAFYNNKKDVAALYNGYVNVVKRYKDNPSLLAWCLGNELIFPFSLTPTPFYRVYNQILDRIHNIDPNHPVCTSIVNVSRRSIIMMKWRVPSLDFYCLNIYNSIRTLQTQLDLIDWVWKGPYLIGEWAPMGGWEAPLTIWKSPIEHTSTTKAKLFYDFFTKYMPSQNARFLGSIAFYWGSRQEYTKSWFSIFDENGSATEIKEALNDCWKGTVTTHVSPKIEYMSIDNMGARDNIIISAGSTHNTALLLGPVAHPDSLQFSWQIFKDWYDSKIPPEAKGLFADSASSSPSFKAPSKAGPYRVFVTVYSSNGYCATANIPIYVVN